MLRRVREKSGTKALDLNLLSTSNLQLMQRIYCFQFYDVMFINAYFPCCAGSESDVHTVQ